MPQKDSTNETISTRDGIWLTRAFQTGHHDVVQLHAPKCFKCTTALSGKGRTQSLQPIDNGNVIYSCNHCFWHITARSLNPTNIKKRMGTKLGAEYDCTSKRTEIGEGSQSHGKGKGKERDLKLKSKRKERLQFSILLRGKEKRRTP